MGVRRKKAQHSQWLRLTDIHSRGGHFHMAPCVWPALLEMLAGATREGEKAEVETL